MLVAHNENPLRKLNYIFPVVIKNKPVVKENTY